MFFKTLYNDIKIPMLGLGTYRLTVYEQVFNAVKIAYKTGYRHFDTADIYGNHRQLAKAFKLLEIPRQDLFITTKIWNTEHGYNQAISSYNRFLDELETDYIDLLLIHWPGMRKTYLDTWQAMIELWEKGKVRAIGVSNFLIENIKDLENNFKILPFVNQIELHPFFVDWQLVNYCQEKNIAIESWAPIAKGRVVDNLVLKNLGQKYGKTSVQVAIRWHLQHGFIVIPKSANPQRIKENFEVWDFELTKQEMAQIDSLSKQNRLGPDPASFF